MSPTLLVKRLLLFRNSLQNLVKLTAEMFVLNGCILHVVVTVIMKIVLVILSRMFTTDE